MPTYNNITITIQVDGTDVPEFLVEENHQERKVTCWVPSQVGKEFTVVVDAERKHRPWSTLVNADGVRANNTAWVDRSAQKQNIGFYRESSTITRPFVFSKLDVVDDDDLLDATGSSHIGEIEIKCQHFDNLGMVEYGEPRKTFESTKKIHERSKKAVAEHVGFGKVVEKGPIMAYKTEWREHIATFVFRYRSLDYLQAQGIAPPRLPRGSPAPTLDRIQRKNDPPARKRNGGYTKPKVKEEPLSVSDGDTSDEELQDLRAKAAEEVKARKRKPEQNSGPSGKKAKRERFSGEVIDLT